MSSKSFQLNPQQVDHGISEVHSLQDQNEIS
jgi:hypothetical protein